MQTIYIILSLCYFSTTTTPVHSDSNLFHWYSFALPSALPSTLQHRFIQAALAVGEYGDQSLWNKQNMRKTIIKMNLKVEWRASFCRIRNVVYVHIIHRKYLLLCCRRLSGVWVCVCVDGRWVSKSKRKHNIKRKYSNFFPIVCSRVKCV